MALPKKVLVILNPVAGHGRKKKRLPAVRSALEQSSIPTMLSRPKEEVMPRDLGRGGQERVRCSAAMGGDGTVSEVVNGLMEAREEGAGTGVRCAVIPRGRERLRRGAGSRSWEEAVQALATPGVRYMDTQVL